MKILGATQKNSPHKIGEIEIFKMTSKMAAKR